MYRPPHLVPKTLDFQTNGGALLYQKRGEGGVGGVELPEGNVKSP